MKKEARSFPMHSHKTHETIAKGGSDSAFKLMCLDGWSRALVNGLWYLST